MCAPKEVTKPARDRIARYTKRECIACHATVSLDVPQIRLSGARPVRLVGLRVERPRQLVVANRCDRAPELEPPDVRGSDRDNPHRGVCIHVSRDADPVAVSRRRRATAYSSGNVTQKRAFDTGALSVRYEGIERRHRWEAADVRHP